ncbi:MAG TPA: FG-GAP repeat protein [Dokdonella sp.]
MSLPMIPDAARAGRRCAALDRGRDRRALARAFCAGMLALAAGSLGATESAILANPAVAHGDEFAYALAMDTTHIVTGTPGEDDATGAVYFFDCATQPCAAAQRVVARDLASGDHFGASVGVAGDTLIVGAPGQSPGAVYVFVRSGANWTQQAKLTATGGSAGDRFGNAAALAADRLLVGADFADARAGAVYVFARSGTAWSQQARLTPADAANGDVFGRSVALDGDTALIGAPMKAAVDASSFARGAAYVFSANGTSWTQQSKLLAGDAADGDLFGQSVAVEGDRALVGAPAAAGRLGAAYVFARSGSAWAQESELAAAGSASGDMLGWSVALSGTQAIVGAPYALSTCGISHVFQNFAGVWSETGGAAVSAPVIGDLAGWSVVAAAGRWTVAAPGHAGPLLHDGVAYYFDAAETIFADGFDAVSAASLCSAAKYAKR